MTQKTKTQLHTDINRDIVQNSSNSITGTQVNTIFNDIVDSMLTGTTGSSTTKQDLQSVLESGSTANIGVMEGYKVEIKLEDIQDSNYWAILKLDYSETFLGTQFSSIQMTRDISINTIGDFVVNAPSGISYGTISDPTPYFTPLSLVHKNYVDQKLSSNYSDSIIDMTVYSTSIDYIDSNINLQQGSLGISKYYNNYTYYYNISMTTGVDGFTIGSNDPNFVGVLYNGAFENNFTDYSLVSKLYVDNKFSGTYSGTYSDGTNTITVVNGLITSVA